MGHRRWLGQYRNELKGIAILWVVFFHALIPCTGILWDIQKLGYGGVDVFFFLTGFGLYHSLKKGGGLGSYMDRRLWRILPAYLPVVVAWMMCMFPGYGLTTTQTIRSAMGNLFMVGFWFDVPKVFNWYVSALFLFILLSPVLYGWLSESQKPVRTLMILLGAAFGIGLCCIGDDRYMGLSRLPIFILGMAFAMDWRPAINVHAKRALYISSFAVGLALVLLCHTRYPELLNDYAMYWHPFVLITPGLCVFLSFLFHKAERVKAVFAPLRIMGEASFEIYLANIWLVELAKQHKLEGSGPWALISVGGILLGLGYHLLVNAGVKRVRQRKQA